MRAVDDTHARPLPMTVSEGIAVEEGAPSPADDQLVRAIGPFGLGATAVNSALGAGIFVLPGLIAAILGPSAILAYLICGVAVALTLTCFIEIGSFVKRSGGTVAYIEEAFGPMMGFLAWLLYSVGFIVFSNAALANVLVDSAGFLWPGMAHGWPRAIALFALFGALAAINIIGVRQGLHFAVGVTIAKLLPLFFVVAGGIFLMHWRQLEWSGWPSASKLGEASLLLCFAFQGTEDALTPSGEIRDPARTVPRGMFGGIATLILLYVALQVVSQGVLGGQLAHEQTAPLAAVGGRILGAAGRALLLGGVAISVLGTVANATLTTPRAFFLAAQNGMLPAALAKVHPRFRTPHIAIVVVAALMFILALTGEFRQLAILSSISILPAYLAVCLGALRLRYTRKREPGAFRAPGGPTVGILGTAMVIWLLAHSTRAEMEALAATVALGIAYYIARRQWLLRKA